jgi:signal transduction histidine kinase
MDSRTFFSLCKINRLLYVLLKLTIFMLSIVVLNYWYFFSELNTTRYDLMLKIGALFLIMELLMPFHIIKQSVKHSLNAFILATQSLIKGDYSRVNELKLQTEREDEIGVLARTFREMSQQFEKSNESHNQYQKKLEFEIAHLTQQLQENDKTLQLLIEKERNTSIEKSHFLAMLAHELKSPLATIEFATENIQRSKNPQIIELSFSHIRKATQDMSIITQRCLQVDKLEQPNSTIIDTTFSLNSLIYESIKGFEAASRLQIDITSPLTVTSDELLYQIVISNLVENALKYSPEKSVVNISVKKNTASAGILISVSNEIGKAGKPDAAKVFEKYYRHTNAQRFRGTGLGLWLVRGIVTQLGGNVNYIEHNNKVKFQVWLPHQ